MRRAQVLAGLTALVAALALSGTASAASQHNSDRSTFTTTVLMPVPVNRVHAVGSAKVRLQGHQATVTVNVRGLIEAPHAMHIHIKGEGECPEADEATLHNGRRAISTTDGLGDYGPIGTSLTTRGDTSPASALAIARFPQTGTFHYTRAIRVSDEVARALRTENAVVVVHGIDYNRNGRYDGVLGPSELDPSFPQEATAPALCGALHDHH